jgi:tRNA A-37 threonylcarbamoyl transferase component Bud32
MLPGGGLLEGTARGFMGQDVEDGRLVGGRYRLEGVLGRGGMGTVWRGRDETLGRTVAVKELRFPNGIDEDEKQRLITRTLREAKAIARVRSESAVTVFDVVDEDDRPWIVMELVEGGSLADKLRADGPLEPRRAAEVGLAVLDVLRAAHRQGILHRDVKPSNVLMEEGTDRVVLTDFGIAKVEGDPSITSTGMLVGAPSYISPERARGKPPGPPADMWSLGGLLYAAVEGRPPYDKKSAIGTLTAVMTEPVPPPEHAGRLTEVILGLLEKDPDKRLDVDGARVLLEAVVAAPDDDVADVPDATRTVMMPPAPGPAADDETASPADARKKETSSGAKAAPAAAAGALSAATADRMRAALQSVRNAAASGSRNEPAGNGGEPTGPMPARKTPVALSDLTSRGAMAVTAAVVMLLVVVGTIVAFAASGDDKGGASDNSTPGSTAGRNAGGHSAKNGDRKASPSASATRPSADDGEHGKGKAGGKHKRKDEGKGKKGKSDKALPEGYHQVTDGRFHFSVAMPENFERVGIAGSNSGGIYAASKGSYPKIQVDYTSSPGDDAVRSWKQLEGAVRGSSDGYKRVGEIHSVEWNGYPTVADWQFERTEHGQRVHVLNRGFKVNDGRGHAILITCKADKWDEHACRTLRRTAFDTFEPA